MKIGLLAVTMANALEVYYISALGTEALMAFTLLLPLLLAFDAAGVGLGAGISSLYARLFASPRCQTTVAVNGILMALSIIASIAFLLWLVRAPLLTLLGFQQPVAVAPAKVYLGVWLMGCPFLITNVTVCALLRAADRSRTAALGMVVGACAAVVLTPMAVHGLFGMPAMGLAGAAAAQVTGAVVTTVTLAVLCGSTVQRHSTMLAAALPAFPRVFRQVVRIGLPATLGNLMIPLGAFLVVQLLAFHSETYVAAYGLAVRLEALLLIVFYAYSSVAGPMFGERLLKEPPEQLMAQLKHCRTLCFQRGLALVVIALPLPLLFTLWPSACQASMPALTQYFWAVPVSYGAYGFVMVANAAFNGMGVPANGIMVSFMRCFGLLLPFGWVLGQAFGPNAIFITLSLSNILAAVFAYQLLARKLGAGAVLVPSTLSSEVETPIRR